ncbi:hypothetical protein G6O67_001760 [Ophiocordyceps sinensis]|uniref:Uncharacterized protein n=2 Tax=Ophiocordyceps sinensis TaxID=72228 RepID=A0A8H4V9H2_9HYPO|nr:hypothetical protein OCS_06921 [Ophiocordyceps sinensis CO18]KAF4512646.1 hypothetical protein G6O67_001760 [Ophiocordyceps sinensis]
MPWRDAPRVDFDWEPQYRWPFWKVGMDEDDLFGQLHQRLNTTPLFIQDQDAFYQDVNEMASFAAKKQEFLARLEERKKQRLGELVEAPGKMAADVFLNRNTDENHRFYLFRLVRYATLDTIIALLASYLPPEENGNQPSLGCPCPEQELPSQEPDSNGIKPSTSIDHSGRGPDTSPSTERTTERQPVDDLE